jgi:hypothetical protein
MKDADAVRVSRNGCLILAFGESPTLCAVSEDCPFLCRMERNRCLLPAYRANRPGFCPHIGATARFQLGRFETPWMAMQLLT